MLMRMHGTWIFAASLAACALAGSALAQGQTDKKPGSSGHPAPPAAQGAKAETPQEFLAKRAGEYTRTIQFIGQQGAAAEPSTGTSKISVILNGRFIQEQNEDVVFGRPVTGMRFYGYNTASKQYESVSLYTGSNAILMLTGTSSDGGRTVDYTGMTDSANGVRSTLHARLRQVDDDQFVLTMSIVGSEGKETPFNEITYKRKK
ncbi:MAG TPA: DUF1579 family protein [Candidatus Acidoferrales bacterium]|nr:DUF1579 family protein [Candidatus Acidoferrales bacterium]